MAFGSFLIGLGAVSGIAFTAVPAAAQVRYEDPRLEAALRSAARSDRALRAFYAQRDYRPLWISDESLDPAAGELLRLIEDADVDGLDPDDYKPRALIAAIERSDDASPKALAKSEILFSRALVAYARDLNRPRNVGTVYLDKELTPTAPTAGAVLTAAAGAPSLRDHVVGMRFVNPVYAELRGELANRRGGGADAPGVWIPDGQTLKPGAEGMRVRIMRQRLGLEPGDGYDAALVAAVREFQAAGGLPVDGVAGPRTIAALNAQPQDRDHLIRINLERARALPANRGGKYILVDAAGARLWLYENGRAVDSMKVIVGKPTEPTPMLAGLMRYAIVNPYWNIPPDLARTRVAPGVISKGVKYLKTMRYEVLSDWSNDAKVVDPKTVDWEAVAAGRTELRVRQLPGKDNSMGKMKFMMPNDLGIYLHDTPDRHLFKEANRYFSSGCVRLEDAPRLAKWLFGTMPKAASKLPEQRVDLPAPVPVYITYLTAAPAGNGLVFRADTYGRDRTATASSGGRDQIASAR